MTSKMREVFKLPLTSHIGEEEYGESGDKFKYEYIKTADGNEIFAEAFNSEEVQAIIHAVNSHDKLVEQRDKAVELLREWLDGSCGCESQTNHYETKAFLESVEGK